MLASKLTGKLIFEPTHKIEVNAAAVELFLNFVDILSKTSGPVGISYELKVTRPISSSTRIQTHRLHNSVQNQNKISDILKTDWFKRIKRSAKRAIKQTRGADFQSEQNNPLPTQIDDADPNLLIEELMQGKSRWRHKKPFINLPLSELIERGKEHWTTATWEQPNQSILSKKACFSIYDDAIIFQVVRNAVQKPQAFQYLTELTNKSSPVLLRRYNDLSRSTKKELLALTELALSDPKRAQTVAGIHRRRKAMRFSLTKLDQRFHSLLPADLLERLSQIDFNWQLESQLSEIKRSSATVWKPRLLFGKHKIHKNYARKESIEITTEGPLVQLTARNVKRNKVVRRKLKKLLGKMFAVEDADKVDINKQIILAERALKVLEKHLSDGPREEFTVNPSSSTPVPHSDLLPSSEPTPPTFPLTIMKDAGVNTEATLDMLFE